MGPNSLYPNSAPNSDNLLGAVNGYQHAPPYPSPEQPPIVAPTPSAASRWANIPAELRALRRWAVAGADKRPLTVSGGGASVNDPDTWTDFDSVCVAAQDRRLGIGFMMGAGYACIDLDVKDDTPQADLDRHQQIVDHFDSYTERSQSGRGYHVLIKADIGDGKRRDGVELYSQARFIICTGDVYRSKAIENRQESAERLRLQLEPHATRCNIELNCPDDVSEGPYAANQLFTSEGEWRTERLRKLACGNESDWATLGCGDGSGSAIDLELVKELCRHTPLDGSVWSAFRMFPQGRRKKGGRVKSERQDYKATTLQLARQHLANDAAHAQDGRSIAAGLFWKSHGDSAGLIAKPLGAFLQEFQAIEYLIDDLFRRGWLYTITGNTGAGKTAIAVTLALHIASGRQLDKYAANQGAVLYIAGENPDDVRGRFKAAMVSQGFPMEVLKTIRVVDQSFLLAERLEELTRLIDDVCPAVVFIDTDQAVSLAGDSDENNNGVRMQHAKHLRALTRCECRPTVLDLCHPNGSADRDNMKPRGGSSLLNEVDGNVGCWRDGDVTSFYSDRNKFRGGSFEITFRKALVELDEVVDTKGRKIPVPVFSIPTVEAEMVAHVEERSKQDRLLISLYSYGDGWTQSAHADHLNLRKDTVSRYVARLREQKLLKEKGLELTPAGRKKAEQSIKMGLQ